MFAHLGDDRLVDGLNVLATDRHHLEIVPIGGEHIQAIDEPIIAKVGEHMSQALDAIESERQTNTSPQIEVGN